MLKLGRGAATVEVQAGEGVPHVGLLSLAVRMFRLGAVSFGGMWAATNAIETELVHRARWLKPEDLQFMLLAANLIPAPKFLGFGGLVGYRLRGWVGSVVAVVALFAPCSLLVLTAVVLVSPDVLSGPLAPLRRAVGIGVVGLLFGNAFQQIKSTKMTRRNQAIGVGLTLVVAVTTIAGIPLILAAVAGFAIGAVVMRDADGKRTRAAGTEVS